MEQEEILMHAPCREKKISEYIFEWKKGSKERKMYQSLKVQKWDGYNIIEMPFYRNLGAIRFQSQIEGFQIFRAEPDTTIFQCKQQQTNGTLETLAECYQIYLHNHNIHCYQQEQKGAALVVPQSKQANLSKASIDDLCRALIEAVKITNNISSYFPTMIGDFTASQLYNINGRLVFVYLPIKQINQQDKIDLELVKGILKLGTQLKEQTNLSHRLLLKKLSKCKTLNELSEQIHYFYSVYGVGSKSTNKPVLQKRDQRMQQPLKKRDNKRKLNLFSLSNLRNKSAKGIISCYSNSLHSSSAPKRNNSLNITLPTKGRMSNRNISNSCSMRQSPFDSLKFKTIDFNSSFRSSEGKHNEESTGKKSLRKSKPNVCESIHTPVSLDDQQKLIKKLHTKKTESSNKKIQSMNSQKQISIVAKSEKQATISKIMKENSIKQLQSPPKLQSTEINAVSVKFPSKQSIEPMQLNIQSRMNSSKTIHKHQSIHVSQTAIQSNTSNQYLPQNISQTSTQQQMQQIQQSKPEQTIQAPQPQVKKLKKKPIVREEEWGSQLEIVDFAKKPEKKAYEPKIQSKKPEVTKQIKQPIKQIKQPIKVPKITIENQSKDPQQGQQTRKNSYKTKPSGQQTVRTNTKYQQLLQKKQSFDYMGKTVVNTSGYLKNYQKIFWQLPLFFLYRAFYIMRLKLARQVQVLNEPEAFKALVIENDQIGQAVNKLIKVVTRKLKKSDPEFLKEIKDYLNIDEKINCDGPMKSLLGEYIESLSDASEHYPQLMKHQIEVVNSYLIAKGQKPGPSIEDKLQTQPQRRAYLNDQLAKLQPFL